MLDAEHRKLSELFFILPNLCSPIRSAGDDSLIFPNVSSYCFHFKIIHSQLHCFEIINFRIARETLEVGEDGKYSDITTIKDDVQHGKALDFELEEKIRIFLKDAHRIGMP